MTKKDESEAPVGPLGEMPDARGSGVPVCGVTVHRWRATYQSGDSCECGVLFLGHVKGGVVEVTWTPERVVESGGS